MKSFILNRIKQSLILLGLVSAIGFFLLHLMPGGPLSQYAQTPGMGQEEIDRISEQMGLNRPLPIQYLDWIWRLLQGDWGRSYRDGQPVLHLIAEHLGATVLLMGSALIVAIAIGAWIGIVSAVRQNSSFDTLASIAAMTALSIPTFWFGLVGIYIFSLELGWLPSGDMFTIGDESVLDYIHHLILPTAVLALVNIAIWSRYMRTAVLEVINSDFVTTARAKGVAERTVLTRHVLGNALLPIITLVGLHIPGLFSGALVTETVFSWPGMGRLFLDSLEYRDQPVVMGILIFTAIFVIVGNLFADLVNALVDPRVRLN
ncbi:MULTISPECIES: ABC transporter permease [Rhizobium/Agrobacterium group]|uniref:ABC transporter permease n=1 Tax=Agrobacterium rosae TaxID=1972867 RepID=UPI0020343A98|nr:ABC transporter permease [Agrobacterium rosae]MCM2436094.1 ABC transporter permease [Agrobacterium rosae]